MKFRFLYICFIFPSVAFASLKEDILPTGGKDILVSNAGSTGEGLLDSILQFMRDSLFSLLFVIAIGMFLYIGARLIVARGNPEEFKKTLQSFIFAALGLFVVAFAWALVRLVAGISF